MVQSIRTPHPTRDHSPPTPMSNKPASDVQLHDAERARSREAPGEDTREDARVERTIRVLRGALAELLQEQTFRDITVQQILVRAGVSRATFYAHFRNKDDALLSSYEGMFSALERQLDTGPSRTRRLVPMAELLEHLAASGAVFASLHASGRLESIWNFGTDLLADMIERRRTPAAAGSALDPKLAARMLAGACVEMTKWWLDHQQVLSPQAMDDRFHQLAHRLPAT
jgi:AcrR family transcriptional regulator